MVDFLIHQPADGPHLAGAVAGLLVHAGAPERPMMATTDPREGPGGPAPQHSPHPGRTADLDPHPDHGEASYVGRNQLDGLAALVTGGDSGIGRAVAIAFAREGADVAITHLPDEAEDARTTAELVRAAGRDALVIEADLRAEQVCHAVVAETVGHFGRLDVLLNNAAFQRSISDGFESLSSEQLERTFATNVFATAGLLGGHLAYARGVGVSTTAFQAGPDEWTDLIAVDQLDRQRPPTAVSRDGVGYVAITVDDDIHVLENRCTHRGAPLAEGTVVGGCIERPWHASRFSLTDGRVAKGPASVDQPAYETRVVDGRVEIRRTELGGLRRASTRP